MPLSLFLAQLIGLYCLIASVAMFLRREEFMSAVGTLTTERATRLIVGYIAVICGLVLVLLHNVWTDLPASLISLVGWIVLVKGALCMWLNEKQFKGMMKFFADERFYLFGSVVSFILGIYLALYGFMLV